jgi:hypothetical protein
MYRIAVKEQWAMTPLGKVMAISLAAAALSAPAALAQSDNRDAPQDRHPLDVAFDRCIETSRVIAPCAMDHLAGVRASYPESEPGVRALIRYDELRIRLFSDFDNKKITLDQLVPAVKAGESMFLSEIEEIKANQKAAQESAQQQDTSACWSLMSSALLAPTRSGRTGESLNNATAVFNLCKAQGPAAANQLLQSH